MPRFMSASQIKALGDRLARSTEAAADDRELLRRLIADYVGPMTTVQDRIKTELGLDSTARPKTEKTTIEKLRRDRTRLNKMQDLAGVRITSETPIGHQDRIVAGLVEMFPGATTADLRDKPGNPYRAVHVIAIIDDCPVEVQVRTPLQHAWADMFERLADATDRRIRYGAVPLDANALDLYERLRILSDGIASVERSRPRAVEALERLRAGHIAIRDAPIPRPGTKARKLRDLALRRLRDNVRMVDDALAEGNALEAEMVVGLHGFAEDIRKGHVTFERGIVE